MSDFPDALRDLRQGLERLEEALFHVRSERGDDPREAIDRLSDQVQCLRCDLDGIDSRWIQRPLAKFGAGQRLTRAEFHLVAAMGMPMLSALGVAAPTGDEYETWDLLHYEDDDGCCCINPQIDPGRLSLNFGRAPEGCRISALRPETREFLEEHRPDVLARMMP